MGGTYYPGLSKKAAAGPAPSRLRDGAIATSRALATNVILEFVDSSMSGEYRLEFDPAAERRLLHVPGVGLTEYEE